MKTLKQWLEVAAFWRNFHVKSKSRSRAIPSEVLPRQKTSELPEELIGRTKGDTSNANTSSPPGWQEVPGNPPPLPQGFEEFRSGWYHSLGPVSDWPCSPCFGKPAGQEAPACPRCGRQVRRKAALWKPVRGGICNLPWNAGWDGECERCGHHFEMVYETRNGSARNRVVRIEPAQECWPVWIDYVQVFAGVKITVVETGMTGQHPHDKSLFLRMPELLRLVRALENELNICVSQYDWDEDTT